jgi:cell division protein FtsB
MRQMHPLGVALEGLMADQQPAPQALLRPTDTMRRLLAENRELHARNRMLEAENRELKRHLNGK